MQCKCVASVSWRHVFVQVMWLADRHSDQDLYTTAKHCAKIHLTQLHQTEEFLNLPLCLFLDIIKGITYCCFPPTPSPAFAITPSHVYYFIKISSCQSFSEKYSSYLNVHLDFYTIVT